MYIYKRVCLFIYVPSHMCLLCLNCIVNLWFYLYINDTYLCVCVCVSICVAVLCVYLYLCVCLCIHVCLFVCVCLCGPVV